jgi:hypothetical protein
LRYWDATLKAALYSRWAEHFPGMELRRLKRRLLAGMPGGESDAIRRAAQTGEAPGFGITLRILVPQRQENGVVS